MTAEVLVPLGVGILVVIVAIVVLLRALRRRPDVEEPTSASDLTGESVEAAAVAAETRPAGTASVAEAIAVRESITVPMPVMPPAPPRSFPPMTDGLSSGRPAGQVVAARPPAVPVARRGGVGRAESPLVPLQRPESADPARMVGSHTPTDGWPVSPEPSDQEHSAAGASTPSGPDGSPGSGDPAPPSTLPRRVGRRFFPGSTDPFAAAPGSAQEPAADAAVDNPGSAAAGERQTRRAPAATAADRVAAARAVAGRAVAERAAAGRAAEARTPPDGVSSGAGMPPSLFEHPVPWQRVPDSGWAASQGPAPERDASDRPAGASPFNPPADGAAARPAPSPTPRAASGVPADQVGSGRPVADAVAHALAVRAAADPTAADPTDVAGDDARDRLLAALLDDPVRAVAAVAELAAGRDQLSRLHDAAEARRGRLSAALEVLARSGLNPTQLARLSGLGDAEIRAMLPSLLA